MKYIRFEDAGFVIFEASRQHKDIADKFPNDKVISAGQISFLGEECDIKAFGESITLHTSSRSNDGEYIARKIIFP